MNALLRLQREHTCHDSLMPRKPITFRRLSCLAINARANFGKLEAHYRSLRRSICVFSSTADLPYRGDKRSLSKLSRRLNQFGITCAERHVSVRRLARNKVERVAIKTAHQRSVPLSCITVRHDIHFHVTHVTCKRERLDGEPDKKRARHAMKRGREEDSSKKPRRRDSSLEQGVY